MDTRVVLDLETKRTFDEVGGRDHLHLLEVSVVGLYHYGTGEYECFEEKDMGRLQNVLINSSLIIGFNHVGFDLPVLKPYLTLDIEKLPMFDILLDCHQRLGHRISLDSLAQATLGIGKTGHGLDAIRYYREGRMQELKDYCLNDVKVTKEIFDYGLQNGKVSYLSKMGQQKKELAVDWKKYSPKKTEAAPRAPAQYKLF